MLSHVQLFVTPCTIAHQAPLSTEFPRQEYWSRMPCPSSGHIPDLGMEPMSSALAQRFTTEPPGELSNVMGLTLIVYTPLSISSHFPYAATPGNDFSNFISFFYLWLFSFPIIYVGYYFPLFVYSWLLSCKLINYICMGLILGFLFCSTHLSVCIYTNTVLFWWLKFCNAFEIWKCDPPSFVLPKVCFGSSGSSMIPNQF